MTINEEKQQLFETVKVLLGAPVRKIELTNEQFCQLFNVAVNDYSSEVQNWLIESQWLNLHGKDISTTDLTFALSTQSIDYPQQFTYAISKQVGLQQRGPYELKKDFFLLEAGKQVYEIPAGREINRVLWATPPAMTAALSANYGGFDTGFGGGMAQVGGANIYGSGGIAGLGGYYIAPAVDVMATAMDMSLKNKILRSDMIYKVTAGPNGTRLIHLMNVPGKVNFSNVGGFGGMYAFEGCAVWYHYYDVAQDEVDECRRLNPDIILTPEQIPLEELDYFHFNSATKNTIRKLLVADAKTLLAMIRGKFSGILSIKEAEATMDYKQLETMGKQEREETMKELRDRLERMSPQKMLERAADQSENLRKVMKGTPLGLFTS